MRKKNYFFHRVTPCSTRCYYKSVFQT